MTLELGLIILPLKIWNVVELLALLPPQLSHLTLHIFPIDTITQNLFEERS